MNQTSGGLGGFFRRMGRVGAGDLQAAARDLLNSPPARDIAAEAGTDAAVTGSEQQWLDVRIGSDGQIDPLEQALLAFLAEA